MTIRPLTLSLLASITLATAASATAGERATASVAVEIVEAVGIGERSVAHGGDLAFALTGQDGLVYDVVVPQAAAARDDRGRWLDVELTPAGGHRSGASWILEDGRDVVQIEASAYREDRVSRTSPTSHETIVFIAYQ